MINKFKEFYWFLKDLFSQRETIWNLSKNDFKVRYVNSYLGAFWGFAQPIITILMFWFIFEIGFRNPPVEDVPFLIWIMCGLIPWTFYSEAINSGTNCLFQYNYLIKKVVFRVSVLPIVKIISSLFIHVVFVLFILIVMMMYKFDISVYCLQAIYYTFCMVILILGTTWITSSVSVFIRDIREIVGIFLQFAFWFAPIVWNFDMVEVKYQWVFKLNPFFYIIQGYRDSFIYKVAFYSSERIYDGLYFWGVTLVLFVCGAIVFRKLRPHFADLL